MDAISKLGDDEVIAVRQLDMVHRHLNVNLISGALSAVLLVAALWPAVAHATLLAWLGAVSVAMAARYLDSRQYLKCSYVASFDLGKWKYRYVAGAVAAGACWAFPEYIFLDSPHDDAAVIVIFIVAGVTAFASVAMSPVAPAVVSFLLLALLPLAAWLFATGERLHYFMGALALIYLGALLMLARHVRNAISASFSTAEQNKALSAAVQEGDQRLLRYFENAPGCFFTLRRSQNGRIAMPLVSKGITVIYGLHPEDVADSIAPMLALNHPDDSGRVEQAINHSAQAMVPCLVEHRVNHPAKGERWVEARFVPHKEGGDVVWHGVMLDITERKRMEEALQRHEQYQRTLLDNSPYFIWLKDKDSRLLAANLQYARVARVASTSELEGKTDFDFFPHDLAEKYVEDDRKVMAGGALGNVEEMYADEHGERRWMETWKSPLVVNGQVAGTVGCSRDITERKRMEEALAAREREFRSLAENLPDNIARFDPLGRYLYINPTHERLLGVSFGEIAGTSIPDSHAQVKAAIARVAASGQPEQIEQRVSVNGGNIELHRISVTPEFDEAGRIVSVLCIGRDMTDTYRTQEALAASEAEFRTLAENLPVAVIRYDAECRRRYLNRAAERALHGNATELLGHVPGAGGDVPATPAMLEFYRGKMEEVLATGAARELDFVLDALPAAQQEHYEVRFMPEPGADGQTASVLAIWHDITGRKRLENELKQREAEFRSLAENLPDPVFRYGRDCRRIYVNPAAVRITATPSEQLLGQLTVDCPAVEAASAARAETAIREVLATGERREILVEYLLGDGRISEHQGLLVPEFDADGQVASVLAIARDMTEIRRLERRQSQFFEIAPGFFYTSVRQANGHNSMPFASRGIRDLFGLEPADVEQDSAALLALIHPDDREQRLRQIEESARDMTRLHYECRFNHPHKGVRWLEADSLPQRLPDGGIRWDGFMHDVTERKAVENALHDSESMLQEAQRIAHVGSWDVDIVNDRLTWSDEIFRIWEIDKTQFRADFAAFVETVHPEDRERVVQAYSDAIVNRSLYEVEHRLLFADGRVKYIQERGEPQYDAEGKPVRFIGTSLDITERKQMETALAEREREFRQQAQFQQSLLSGMRDAGIILVVVENGCFVYTNDHYVGCQLGYAEGQLPATVNFIELIHPDDRPRIAAMHRDRQAGKPVPNTYEIGALGGDGSRQEYEFHVMLVPETDPQQTLLLTLRIDERKRMEAALAARERDFRSLAENLPDNIARWDTEGRYLYINPTHERTLGVAAGEVIGKPLPDTHDHVKAAVAQVVASGQTVELVRQSVPVNGELQTHEVSLVPEFDDAGRVVSVLGLGRNMTEFYRMQDAIAAREQEFRSLAENMPDNIARWDCQGRYTYINPNLERLFGGADHVIGKTKGEAFPDGRFAEMEANILNVVATGKKIIAPRQLVPDENGEIRLHDLTLVPEFDAAGHVVGVLGIGHDMTDIYRMQEALVVREREFRSLAENTPDNIARWDREGRIRYSNPVHRRTLGKSAAELLGKTHGELFPDGRFAEFDATMARIVASGEGAVLERVLVPGDNGEMRQHEVKLVPELDAEGKVIGVLGMGRDMTGIYRMQETIAAREQEFRSLAESSPDFIIRYDREGRTRYLNTSLVRELELDSPDEVIGKRPSDTRSDGRFDSLEQAAARAVETGEMQSLEMIAPGKGGALSYVMVSVVPERDANGDIVGTIAFGRDVTELRGMERLMQMIGDHMPGALTHYRMRADLSGELLYASRGLKDIYDVTREELADGLAPMIARIHPDDLPKAVAEQEHAANTLTTAVSEFRVNHSEKGEIWVQQITTPIPDADGSMLWYSLMFDITERKRMETALAEREQEFRSLAESSPDFIIRYDREGRIRYLNAVLADQLGMSYAAEAIGKRPSEKWPDGRFDAIEQAAARVVESGAVTTLELCMPGEAGEPDFSHILVAPERDAAGQIIGTIAFGRDISQLKRVEAQLKESEARYRHHFNLLRSMLESASDVSIYALDREYRYLSFNNKHREGARNLWGADIAVGMSMLDAIDSEAYREFCRQSFDHVLAGQDLSVESQAEIVKDGSPAYVYHENYGSPIFNDDGEVVGLTVFSINITERKRMEAELVARAQEFRALVEQAPEPIIRYAPDGRRIYVNAAVEGITGIPASVLLGELAEGGQLVSSPQGSSVTALVLRICETGEPGEIEVENVGADGRLRYFHMRFAPEFGADGKVRSVLSICHDVTGRKLAEQSLEKTHWLLRNVLQGIPDPVWMKDADGAFVVCNQGVARLFNKKEEEIIGKTDYDFFDAELAEFYRNKDRTAQETDGGCINEEWWTFGDNGEQALMETRKVAVRSPDGQLLGVLGVARDITGRKRAEETLRVNEEKIRSLFELSPLGIALTDMQGRYVEFNEAFRAICGYPADELMTLDYWTLTPREYEAQEALQLEALARTGRYGPYEKEYRQKDGTLVPIQLNGMHVTGQDGQQYIWSIVEDITERKRTGDVLGFIAQGDWLRSGDDFLNALVRYLGKLLGADYVIVDKIAADPAYAETMALYARGDVVPNIRYGLQSTPCGEVMSGRLCCYHENVQGQFPEAGLLRDMQAESYVGLPLWDAEGKVIGLIAVLDGKPMADTDSVKSVLQMVASSAVAELTRSQMERILHAKRESLNEAQRMSHVGNWDLDLGSGALFWSDEIFRIFEIDPGQFDASYDAFLDAIHPDDRETVSRAYADSLANRAPYEVEHRLLFADGRIKYVLERCETHYAEDGQPLRSSGTVQDITLRKQAENALRERELFLDSLLNAVPIPVFYKDREGRYLGFNRAYEAFFGTSRENLVGKTAFDISPRELAEIYHAKDAELFEQGEMQQYESQVRNAHGAVREVIFNKALFADSRGATLGLIGALLDITERKQAEQRLAQALDFSEGIINAIPDLLFEMAVDGTYLNVWAQNPALLAAPKERLLGRNVRDMLPAEAAETMMEAIRESGEHGLSFGKVFRLDLPHGESWFEISSSRKAGDGPSGYSCLMMSRDITERKHMEEALAVRERELSTLIDNTPDTIARYNRDGRRTFVNEAFCELVDGGAAILLGTKPTECPGGANADIYEAKINEVFVTGLDTSFELHWKGKDGEAICSHIRLTAERDMSGAITTVLGIGHDITELNASRQKIHQMAFYDTLTSLPNRALFNDRLRQMLTDAEWHGQQFGVMLLDLDRFKAVNDSLGHPAGDELLREAAGRLRSCVRAYDTVARLGGDEFAILLPEMRISDDLGRIAGKILDSFKEPFLLEGKEVFISTSIGIAVYPDDSCNADELIKQSDSAMYFAKRSGRNDFRFYSKDLTESASEKLMLESELRRALERHELELYYQPKVWLADDVLIGCEALLRWKHPQRGMVPPDQFIGIAEDSGLIVGIGEWVLRDACRTASEWNGADKPLHKVAINLSARQFQSGNLVQLVKDVLEETDCYPEWIELEITESLLLDEDGEVLEILEAFRAMGISIAIDDFGTGYSALSYLARYPINTLKIDRSFISTITTDSYRAELVKAIISIAHCLGQQVVAEGVETIEQAAFLQANGCQMAQGYLYSKPIPKPAFALLPHSFAHG